MREMKERVARAIQRADFEDAKIPWEWINPEGQSDYRTYARAAIEAMREPTQEMIDAAVQAGCIRNLREGWQAMIDAALRPQERDPA